MVVNISSDAGAEHYETWGGYGSSKAALDHQTLTWAVEEPQFTWYASIPAICARPCTRPHTRARTSVTGPSRSPWCPSIAALISSGRPSGRYRAADLARTPPAAGAA